MTSFANKIILGRGQCGLRWILNPLTAVSRKGERDLGTETHMPKEEDDGGRDWSEAAINNTENCWQHQRQEKQGSILPLSLWGAWPTDIIMADFWSPGQ